MPAPSVTCPHCDAPLPADGSECPRCGPAGTLRADAPTGPTEPASRVDPTEPVSRPHRDIFSAPDYEFLAPPERPDELGRLGHYRVLGVLGRGGMGVVFRAEDTTLRRLVALKVMLRDVAAGTNAAGRFLREARAQAAVEHDHVVVIHHVGEENGTAFLAMPLLRGLTLAAALKANPRPPVAEVVRIGREIAEGLAAAHAQGLIHRDVKPGNVWLEGDRRRVKILDFGLARAAADADPEDADRTSVAAGLGEQLTTTGAVVGTPAYMSPEQAAGGPVDPRTDLFSLGAVLYQMATGRSPFARPTAAESMAAVLTDEPDPPAALAPDLSRLIVRLLAKDPNGRPPYADAVADDLRQIELGLTAAVRVIPLGAVPGSAPDPWADLDSTVESTAPPLGRDANRGPPPRPTRWFGLVWAGLALAVVGGAGLLTAGLFQAAAAKTGTLVIDAAADPAAEVVVKMGRDEVRGRTAAREIALPVGEYTVELAGRHEGTRLVPDRVLVPAGGRVTVRVETKPTPGGTHREETPVPVPPGWQVLFDGKDASRWEVIEADSLPWAVKDGHLEIVPGSGSLRTKDTFRDCELYLEYWLGPPERGTGRAADSGVFFHGLYEVQILDDHGTPPRINASGGLCQLVAPTANASKPAGVWQTLHVVFIAPRLDAAGTVVVPGRATVVLNGVTVLDRAAFDRTPLNQGQPVERGPIVLQRESGGVRFRNIRVRPVVESSTFDDLDPAKVPAAERIPGLPTEVVGVIGSGRGSFLSGGELAFSPDGKWVVGTAMNQGRSATVWDAATLTPRHHEPAGYQKAVSFAPAGNLAAVSPVDAGRMQVRILDLTGPVPRPVKDLAFRNENTTTGLLLLPDGKTLATGTGCGGLYLWDYTGPGKVPTHLLKKPTPGRLSDAVNGLTTTADGRILAAQCWDDVEKRGAIRRWDLTASPPKESPAVPMDGHSPSPTTALTPDGRLLITGRFVPRGRADQAIRVWDLSGPAPREVASARPAASVATDWVGVIGFTDNGTAVVIRTGEGGQVWGLAGGFRKLRDLPAGTAAVSADGTRAVRAREGRLDVLDAAAGQVVVAGADPVIGVNHHPAVFGGRVVTTFNGTRVWTVRDGMVVPGEQDKAVAARVKQKGAIRPAVSPDGKWLAGIGADGGVHVYPLDGDRVRLPDDEIVLGPHNPSVPTLTPDENIAAFAWGPDAKTIAARRDDGTIDVWDATKRPPTRRVVGSVGVNGDGVGIAYASTGRHLAVSDGSAVVVWDLAARKPTRRDLVAPADSAPSSAAFAPDGRLLVGYLGSLGRGSVWQYDVSRRDTPGEAILTTRAAAIRPAPVGTLLATNDGTGWTFWDLATRRPVAAWPNVAPSPLGEWADDGRHFLAGLLGAVYVMRVANPESDREIARWLLSRNGTALELDLPGGKTVLVTAGTDPPAGPFTFRRVELKTPLTDADLNRLAALPRLGTLYLIGSHTLTDDGLRPLLRWQGSLTFLALGSGPITDDGLKTIARLHGLTGLDLRWTQVTDAGLKHLAELGSLEALNLWRTAVTDDGLKHVVGLKSLAHLTLADTAVTDAGLGLLVKIPSLRLVELNGTNVTAAGVMAFAASRSQCKIVWDGGTVEPTK